MYTAVPAMGNEPLPPPIRSLISPPLPVAAPLNGSTVVGKLCVSAFSEMTVLTSSSLKKLGLAAAAGWNILSLGPSMNAQLSLYAETILPGLTADVFFISLNRDDSFSTPSMMNLPLNILCRQCSELT